MLKGRFHRWAIAKYITKKDSLAALERIMAYRREHGFSPDTVVVRGRTLSAEKVVKHLKRHSDSVRSLGVQSGSEHSSAPINAGREIDEYSPRSQDRFGEPWPGEAPAEIETEGDEEVGVTNRGSRLMSISALVEQSPSPQQLASEELSTLYVAILQTDYHLRDQEFDEHNEDQSTGRNQQDQWRGSPRLPAYTFASPPGMRNFEIALHQTNNYYDGLADIQRQKSWTLSSRQQTQARDFYARYWVGLGLLDNRKYETAFSLFKRADDHIITIVEENHPHFLPWMCFVACYPFQTSHHHSLQEQTLRFSRDISTTVLTLNHPMPQIQQQIVDSEYRKDICLALLRRVIEIFRHETQDSHLQELQLLAKLFDEVDKIDEGNVEMILAQWAASSLSIAEIIKEDRRKQMEKEEAGSHRI